MSNSRQGKILVRHNGISFYVTIEIDFKRWEYRRFLPVYKVEINRDK